MSKRHTPGPWAAAKNLSTAHTFNVIEQGGSRICEVFSGMCNFNSNGFLDEPATQGEANARLIAASPELLAALEEIKRETLVESTFLIAAAAIAKATGG